MVASKPRLKRTVDFWQAQGFTEYLLHIDIWDCIPPSSFYLEGLSLQSRKILASNKSKGISM